MTPFQLVFCGLLAATWLYASLKGGPPERIVASCFLVGAVASRQAELSRLAPFQSVEIGILGVDLLMLVVLVCLALVSTRYWPMIMASLQGPQVIGHLARLMDHDTLPRAYFVLAVFWSFPMVLLLATGTWRHRKRKQNFGRDYSWIWELPQAYREGAPYGELP